MCDLKENTIRLKVIVAQNVFHFPELDNKIDIWNLILYTTNCIFEPSNFIM